MDEATRPHYWAVLPADVRYDPELRPMAKILYAEISALCGKEGYCWATNAYFAELYGVGEKTVSEWINQLKSRGYVFTMLTKTKKGMISGRKIWTFHTAPRELFAYPDFSGDVSRKSSATYPEKSGDIDNNTSNNKTPYNPPQGDRTRQQQKPDMAGDRQFAEFWTQYPRKKDKRAAFRAWCKLDVTPELFERIMQQLTVDRQSRQWTKDGKEFVPYPATWLNRRPWEDDPDGGDHAGAQNEPVSDGWEGFETWW